MVLLRLSWKEFRSRPVRTLLTLSSIVIGVGAVVSVWLTIENTRAAQKSMLQAVSGRTSLEVQAEGGTAFDGDVLETIRALPGVQLATGVIRRNTVMFYGQPEEAEEARSKKKVKGQFIGVDPALDKEFREYHLVEGAMLGDAEQILVDKDFAKSLGLHLGGVVRFSTHSGLRQATVVGLVEPHSGSSVLQGGLVVLPIQLAQRWSKAQGRFDAIQILATQKTEVAELGDRIREVVPDGLKVQVPSLQNELGNESTRSMEQGLKLASAFSLIIAIFIIYNTFQMNVGERRRQLGILRALGTTRKQIEKMIVLEGLVLGIVGTLLGWVLGYFATRWLSGATSTLTDLEIANYQIAWTPFEASAGLGISVALAGAYFPAKRASRLSPSEAMRVVSSGELEPSNRSLAVFGALLSTLGLIVLMLCIRGSIHIDHAITGCVAFLLGLVIALPTFLEPATKLVIRCFGGWLGVEGWLAQRQLMRNRGRSSLTIGVLFIALSFGLGMACTILDNIDDVRKWSEEALVGDFFVRATMPSMATGQAADMPLGLVERIKSIDGVKDVETLRFVSARTGNFAVVVVAREFLVAGRKLFDVIHGAPEAIFEGLQRGDIVIGSVLAERAKLKLDDELSLETQSGTVSLKIVGIANDYVAAGLTVYMNRKQAEELLKIEGNDAIIVDTQLGKTAIVETALRSICDTEGLILQSQNELLRIIRDKVDRTVSGLWGLLALGSLIAAFGLVNTLSMNILEQTAEIGMLRVVAMTRSQVRKTVFSQALLMGLIGLIPGVFAGLFIAYLLSLSLLPTTGHDVSFVFRPWLMIGMFFVELAVVVVASLIPAERAARISVSKAMQFQ